MSTYPLEKLLSLWKSGEIQVEQAMGYLIQNCIMLEKRLEVLEKTTKSLKPPPASNNEEVKH